MPAGIKVIMSYRAPELLLTPWGWQGFAMPWKYPVAGGKGLPEGDFFPVFATVYRYLCSWYANCFKY